jgi:hypothetical protein
MNAPRICKLSNGGNKTPQFLNFSTANRNKDHCAIVNCEGVEFLKLDALTIVNYGMKKKFIPSAQRIFTAQI